MGLGWLLGGIFAIFYSALCFWIGYKKPHALFELTRKKLGGKAKDQTVVVFCYVFSVIAIIVAIILFYNGMSIGL